MLPFLFGNFLFLFQFRGVVLFAFRCEKCVRAGPGPFTLSGWIFCEGPRWLWCLESERSDFYLGKNWLKLILDSLM